MDPLSLMMTDDPPHTESSSQASLSTSSKGKGKSKGTAKSKSSDSKSASSASQLLIRDSGGTFVSPSGKSQHSDKSKRSENHELPSRSSTKSPSKDNTAELLQQVLKQQAELAATVANLSSSRFSPGRLDPTQAQAAMFEQEEQGTVDYGNYDYEHNQYADYDNEQVAGHSAHVERAPGPSSSQFGCTPPPELTPHRVEEVEDFRPDIFDPLFDQTPTQRLYNLLDYYCPDVNHVEAPNPSYWLHNTFDVAHRSKDLDFKTNDRMMMFINNTVTQCFSSARVNKPRPPRCLKFKNGALDHLKFDTQAVSNAAGFSTPADQVSGLLHFADAFSHLAISETSRSEALLATLAAMVKDKTRPGFRLDPNTHPDNLLEIFTQLSMTNLRMSTLIAEFACRVLKAKRRAVLNAGKVQTDRANFLINIKSNDEFSKALIEATKDKQTFRPPFKKPKFQPAKRSSHLQNTFQNQWQKSAGMTKRSYAPSHLPYRGKTSRPSGPPRPHPK